MSTKKKRKSSKPRKPSVPPKFNVGDRVRVKYGVADPDFSDIPLGGWAGTITEVDRRGRMPLFLVEWDQYTLDHMHPVFRKRCDRDGLEETTSWLGCEVQHRADPKKPVSVVQSRSRDRGLLLGFLGSILGLSGRQEEEPDDNENCLPLDQIEMKKSGHTWRLLADYAYWFHNH